MVKVAPSLLAADFCRLGKEIDAVSTADWLHLDVMDGQFVPNFSLGAPIVASVRKYTRKFLDVHLMIQAPVRYVEQFAQAGADSITVHIEADSTAGLVDALEQMRCLSVKRGIALRPGTPAEQVFPYLEQGLVDLVLIMTVEPGFGGQAFLENQLPKIAALRDYRNRHGLTFELETDGGMDANTAPLCTAAGVSVLVAGSSIFGAQNRETAIAQLRGGK